MNKDTLEGIGRALEEPWDSPVVLFAAQRVARIKSRKPPSKAAPMIIAYLKSVKRKMKELRESDTTNLPPGEPRV